MTLVVFSTPFVYGWQSYSNSARISGQVFDRKCLARCLFAVGSILPVSPPDMFSTNSAVVKWEIKAGSLGLVEMKCAVENPVAVGTRCGRRQGRVVVANRRVCSSMIAVLFKHGQHRLAGKWKTVCWPPASCWRVLSAYPPHVLKPLTTNEGQLIVGVLAQKLNILLENLLWFIIRHDVITAKHFVSFSTGPNLDNPGDNEVRVRVAPEGLEAYRGQRGPVEHREQTGDGGKYFSHAILHHLQQDRQQLQRHQLPSHVPASVAVTCPDHQSSSVWKLKRIVKSRKNFLSYMNYKTRHFKCLTLQPKSISWL